MVSPELSIQDLHEFDSFIETGQVSSVDVLKRVFDEFPGLSSTVPRKFLSLEMQLYLVRMNPFHISYLENPCEEIQLTAVQLDSRTIKYIDNPSDAALMLAKLSL